MIILDDVYVSVFFLFVLWVQICKDHAVWLNGSHLTGFSFIVLFWFKGLLFCVHGC